MKAVLAFVAVIAFVSLAMVNPTHHSTTGAMLANAATIYLNDSFDTFGGHWKRRNNGQDSRNPGPVIVSEGFSGKGLRIRLNAGTHKAADYEYRFASQPTELYFRYYLRLGDNWKPTDTGKLPGPANVFNDCGLGNKPCSDSKPGFSARMWFSGRVERTGVRDWEQGHSRIGYYVYHMNQQNSWGDTWRWNRNGVDMQLARGQWHCVEGRIKLNTPGQPDGILRAWLNGKRLDSAHSDDIVFRTASQANTKIRAFWLDVYHGGPVSAPATMDVYVDALVLSSARVGCGFGKSFTDLSGTHQTNVEELTMRGGTLRCSPAHRYCQGSGAAVTRWPRCSIAVWRWNHGSMNQRTSTQPKSGRLPMLMAPTPTTSARLNGWPLTA